MNTIIFRRNIARVPTFANRFRTFCTEEAPKSARAPKNNVTTGELVDQLAAHSGESKAAVKRMLASLPIVIRESLDTGKDVNLYRVANFRHVQAAARTMTNMKTKEKYEVPARTMTKARVAPFLKK